MVKAISLSLWLPLAVMLVSYLRFGLSGESGSSSLLVMDPMAVLMLFAIAWPCGIPLTLAIRLLHRRTRATSYLCAAVLGPITVVAVIMGGLLGPVGIAVYSLAVSVPAWLALVFARPFRPRTA